MRLFALAAVMLASATTANAHAQDVNMKKATALLEEAATAFRSGKAKEAAELATKAAELDPEEPRPRRS